MADTEAVDRLSMECQSKGICYFADLVRQKRMLQAKALSLIALVPLMCQIDLIRIFTLLVVQLSEYDRDLKYKQTNKIKQNCKIPRKSKENIFILFLML